VAADAYRWVAAQGAICPSSTPASLTVNLSIGVELGEARQGVILASRTTLVNGHFPTSLFGQCACKEPVVEIHSVVEYEQDQNDGTRLATTT
jgi:hypothetical protein